MIFVLHFQGNWVVPGRCEEVGMSPRQIAEAVTKFPQLLSATRSRNAPGFAGECGGGGG